MACAPGLSPVSNVNELLGVLAAIATGCDICARDADGEMGASEEGRRARSSGSHALLLPIELAGAKYLQLLLMSAPRSALFSWNSSRENFNIIAHAHRGVACLSQAGCTHNSDVLAAL